MTNDLLDPLIGNVFVQQIAGKGLPEAVEILPRVLWVLFQFNLMFESLIVPF